MNPLILLDIRLTVPQLSFKKVGFDIKQQNKQTKIIHIYISPTLSVYISILSRYHLYKK